MLRAASTWWRRYNNTLTTRWCRFYWFTSLWRATCYPVTLTSTYITLNFILFTNTSFWSSVSTTFFRKKEQKRNLYTTNKNICDDTLEKWHILNRKLESKRRRQQQHCVFSRGLSPKSLVFSDENFIHHWTTRSR